MAYYSNILWDDEVKGCQDKEPLYDTNEWAKYENKVDLWWCDLGKTVHIILDCNGAEQNESEHGPESNAGGEPAWRFSSEMTNSISCLEKEATAACLPGLAQWVCIDCNK